MHDAFISINNVPTHVMTWGKWIEEDLTDVQDIVLFIPGNPGLLSFYTKFLETIYQQLGERIPVWSIGHAGHELPSQYSIQQSPALYDNENLYNLTGQIQHKVVFLKKFIPEKCRLHLISHSIGSYMALELLQEPQIQQKLTKNYLLFPTIEHMAKTSRGRFLSGFVRHIVWLILILTHIFAALPSIIQTFLIKIYLFVSFMPQLWCEQVIEFVQPNTIQKVLFMAMDEMDNVNDRNDAVIKEFKPKLKFYYSKNDHWAPEGYYRKLKEAHPDLDATLCPNNWEHAFVVNHSRDAGVMVANWIQETL